MVNIPLRVIDLFLRVVHVCAGAKIPPCAYTHELSSSHLLADISDFTIIRKIYEVGALLSVLVRNNFFTGEFLCLRKTVFLK